VTEARVVRGLLAAAPAFPASGKVAAGAQQRHARVASRGAAMATCATKPWQNGVGVTLPLHIKLLRVLHGVDTLHSNGASWTLTRLQAAHMHA
jgi:hypothetical protein